MSRPGEGFFEVPGAALGTGYRLPNPPDETYLADELTNAHAALDDQAEREAALPPDPGLVNARNAIAQEYAAAAATWAARKQRHYADPDRVNYKPEGLT